MDDAIRELEEEPCVSEFAGKEFSGRLETDGTEHEQVATDAPWQNGKTERHRGTLKLMVCKARLATPLETSEDLEEHLQQSRVAKIGIALTLVGGYSSQQRVVGMQMRLPGQNVGD